MICWDISGAEGVSQCYSYCGFLLLWVKVACGSVSEFIVVSIYFIKVNLLRKIYNLVQASK